MRHRIRGRKFNRTSAHRKSMFQNLAKSLIEHEQIVTTLPKAKDLRPIVEKFITLGKKGDLNSRRILASRLQDEALAKKVFDVLAPRYAERSGGYIRIIKNGFRRSDMAPIAVIEFVERDVTAKGKKDLERVAQEQAELAALEA